MNPRFRSLPRLPTLVPVLSAALLLSACAVNPVPLTSQEIEHSAALDRKAMFDGVAPIAGKLSLAEAVARAIRYNLDHRVKQMEQALALHQLDVGRWEMLPKLTADAGYQNRSEYYVTDSVSLATGAVTQSQTYSQDRKRHTADLAFSWNVLDFGVSYYNAKQSADRALIAEERRRKVINNLTRDVSTAYWRAVAAQSLKSRVERTIADAERALDDAATVEKERLRAPLEALRYQKSLLDNLRQLELVNQELATAKVELAALINLPPGSDFTVDTPERAPEPWAMPLPQMEELAFGNNPDIREQVYRGRISVDETRKAVLKLLPGIGISAAEQYDSNSLLRDNHWNEVGVRVSWNLFNLLLAPSQIATAEAAERLEESRRLALRMAVLAQVHIAELKYRNALAQYRRIDRLYRVDQRIAALVARQQENSLQSVLERVSHETGAILTELRRYQALADVEASLARIHDSIGTGLLSAEGYDERDLGRLTAGVEHGLVERRSGRPAK